MNAHDQQFRSAVGAPDLKQARVFTRMLDGGRDQWEFRTFDDVRLPDRSKRGDPSLIKTFRGTLDHAAPQLQRLNAQGAGVFVTVNRTDGNGIGKENVKEVVAVFADTDGAPLEPLLALKPHICVQSSPGNWHIYWRVSDCPLDQFTPVQQAIAKKFGTDPVVCDAGRVMRLPGFDHRKVEPTMVTFVPAHMDPRRAPYALSEIVEGLGLTLSSREKQRANREAKGGDENYPPSSALKIIERCATLAHIAAAKGNVSEPLWRAMLGVVKFTIEGEPLCHEWSAGESRYEHDETQDKIDRWTVGPTRCATFRNFSDSKCEGCAQTCWSPIQLGYDQNLDPLAAAALELNLTHFVAKVGGGVFVFDERDKSLLANGMRIDAFRNLHANWSVNGKLVATEWFKSPHRRTFKGLTFDPSGRCIADSFNLWRGLAIEPQPGACKVILTHIREVWCSGNEAQFDYVLKWMALLVQRPWKKPEVALVLRSTEGAGKTIIVEILLTIFGIHGFTTAQKDQVAGRFNGHLIDKVLIVLEEAFFAGDPAAVAAAKALITNQTISYEAKGKDSISAPNYAHVISLTNHDWAVPAGEDSRRWMVLDISDDRKGDHRYFSALAGEIDNGGAEAFLHYLLNIDLAGFNPRALPDSNALRGQQIETLRRTDPVAAWWLGVLAEGAFTLKDGGVDWSNEISASDMHDSYAMATARARNAPSFDIAAKKLRALLPRGALGRSRKSTHGERFFSYKLPDLDEAREFFNNVTGIDPCAT